ncbi:YceG-like protein [Methylophaga frappieri]|uniref:Endolytic murein transglycosylase n=1 Tax=Methylophaga frappieri (strain ATCC BAA-2434 / DSM 25690 / JAM7) TaxID=754477 RepID=I1YLL3_METFJ|nr:endolytic transglycosylase MltG [Methylophaga frappieri]AFJ03806.1 YceG-like protein [Methylophaga frappieri]
MKLPVSVKIFSVIFVLAIPAFIVWNEYQRFVQTPLDLDDSQLFQINKGDNLSRVSQRLFQQGLSATPSLYLDLYGRWQGVAGKIQAGEYEITSGMTMPALLDKFVSGHVMQYRITVIEGMTAQQLLIKVREHPKITTVDPAMTLEAMLHEIDAQQSHPEGWFLPETYQFTAGTTDIEFLNRAYQKMQTVLDSAWQSRHDDLPYSTPYEVLIMASIIEKETGIAEERPEIAGVFVRRLNKGMRLQTDPTVIYGMGELYDGNIRRQDLRTDTPYNTYTRHGLPPTPICLPSEAAIEAALNPAQGDYLYFVATGEDGRHQFSTNLDDHNRAVRKYQLKQ